MLFSLVFGIDIDVIKVCYHKNIKFLCQNLVDVTLERGRYVGQFKKYHLVLKMAIAGLKSRFSFVFFSNLYLIIGICQIKLGEILSSISSI